jgi:hypothetical protein
MKLGLAIEEVHSAEGALVQELLRVSERHKADHDVHHLAQTLASKARERMKALEPHGERYEVKLGDPPADGGGLVGTLREKGSELAGRRSEAGLLLMRDLRKLHLLAAEASIDWTVLGQGAQAARDSDLLATVSECHPETLRALKWTTTRLKEAAPQVLTS